MKKYIIKNADGSEQTVMRAVHNSRKEAGKELMRYLSYRNDNCDVDNYCFKTPERAEQFGKQFDDLYNKVFL